MTSADLSKIPSKGHYSVQSDYFNQGRIHSYAHQIKTVIGECPSRILEVGKGPGMVTAALKSVGVEVVTLDMQPELEPDLVGSVTEIPSSAESFDVSLCCQVLEHLPFDQFVPALKELKRVTRNALVMSLPDATPHSYIKIKLPKLPDLAWEFSRPQFRLPAMPAINYEKAGHFWEIGYQGTSQRDVNKSIMTSGWKVARSWRVPELAWHRFFLLKKPS